MSFFARHPILRLVASPQHLWRTLSLGLKTIWLHKLRSFLTALGVVFGVASVVAMLAIGWAVFQRLAPRFAKEV